MLKMLSRSSHSGSSSEYWEEQWESGGGMHAAPFCALDPVRPVIDGYVKAGTTLLEGGCGHGHYVSYYDEKGAVPIGLDFAGDTLARLHKREPHLRLALGDVARLPFRDGAFDVYYSGGVVEHFESGPDDAIREARRVLNPSGTLLISVPYLSPLRHLLAPFRKEEWRRVSREETSPEETLAFTQYVYTPREFSARLRGAGFEVLDRRGYAVVWGFQDVAPLRKLLTRASAGVSSGSPAATHAGGGNGAAAVGGPTARRSSVRSLVKRVVVAEDDSVPVVGLALRAARWFGSNMMLYVCVPASPAARAANAPHADAAAAGGSAP